MSKSTATENPHQSKLDAATAEHGKIVSVTFEGELLMFRRPKRAELVNMNRASRKQPDMAIEHAIGLCRVCHVGPGPKEDVDKWANEYTIVFAGSDDYTGIADHLINLSKGEANIVLS